MPRDYKIRGYTVGQSPNAPILVAFAALLLGWLVDSGTVHDVARAVFYVAITIWAYEEAANGVNGFRRALGIVGLILIVISIAGSIA
jgi:hypothetical protein